MNTLDLLMEGLRLMAIGMGIVFAFLLLLVGVMRAMSALAMRLAPDPGLAVGGRMSGAAEQGDAELIAVITAAVARYRRRA
jgi:oxaloacetate decarboxylase gamma subunit